MLANNDHKHSTLHASEMFRQARTLLDDFHLRHLAHDNERFLSFALFFDEEIQQTKISSHLIMSVFIGTICPFDYNASERSKKWEANIGMHEKHLLQKADRHFRPAKNYYSSRGILGENAFKDTPLKRILPNKRARSSSQNVGSIILGDVKVSPPPKKRTGTKRSTTAINIITKSVKSRRMAAVCSCVARKAGQSFLRRRTSKRRW